MKTSTRGIRIASSTLALGSAVALLAGCATPPAAESGPSASKSSVVPCIVSDQGGFDDKAFNQLGLEGMTKAAKDLGTEVTKIVSKSESDFAANLDALKNQGCTVIATMGFQLASATKDAAAKNPDTNYLMIDDGSIKAPNVKAVVWDTSQPGFLAGYAAASYSKTGTVGTYGGANVPPVTLYMDGFARGVNYYNTQKSKSVKVVGWNVDSRDGLFTGNFTDINAAKALTESIIQQNADVILPVGGAIYKGSVAAIRDSGKSIALIGVDSDQAVSDPGNADLFLTSIARDMPKSIADAVETVAKNSFTSDPYVGTFQNEGVFLAPFHNFQDKVAPELQSELDKIKQGIVGGQIVVDSPYHP